ncbi:MAG TPA: malate synthase A [Candidatus Sulfotelmatobacter sp.]|nr:malate synthase A [Candidatus Sulfotelmatobacter sp.]
MTRSSLHPSLTLPRETSAAVSGVSVRGRVDDTQAPLLTDDALIFLGNLERRFGTRRRRLLEARAERQARLDAGTEVLGFPAETADVRATDWTVAPVPADLQDRRVEITGPVDRKMIINALNSGARAFMADFEDSSTPTWSNMIQGQVNLFDAVRRTISFADETSGKSYRLNERTAVLIVRPRGWHLDEAHLRVDGAPMSASLFDFGLFAFHNATELLARGSGPYFYLPKIESRHEAALWRDVFDEVEHLLDLPAGAIRATVLIETLPAAFEMDEILYELRDHIVGLNCGRWDYIFSMIKTLGTRADFILPDRAQVTMTSPALLAYSQLLIKTCHRRGAHAMGGMAAQIPVRGDDVANAAAFDKVRVDKEREAGNGHDGTWVAHPGLVPVAAAAFDAVMPGANQVARQRDDVSVCADDLTRRPEGTITETGLRGNIRVGIQYIESWLRGQGCVPLYNLMEDAATAEICRIQVWQWLRHGVVLDNGQSVTVDLVRRLVAQEMSAFHGGQFDAATGLFLDLCLAERPEPFLTLSAYRRLLAGL